MINFRLLFLIEFTSLLHTLLSCLLEFLLLSLHLFKVEVSLLLGGELALVRRKERVLTGKSTAYETWSDSVFGVFEALHGFVHELYLIFIIYLLFFFVKIYAVLWDNRVLRNHRTNPRALRFIFIDVVLIIRHWFLVRFTQFFIGIFKLHMRTS